MNRKGAVLFEMLYFVGVMVGILFLGHLCLLREEKVRIQRLQNDRLSYDGVLKWKPRLD